MIALLDVSFLLPLVDRDHQDHDAARTWFLQNRETGWATCPIVQNGCIRILTQPSYPSRVSMAAAVGSLHQLIQDKGHVFWADDFSICDGAIVDRTRITGPNALTDIYLLALAVRHQGRLATFDRRIAAGAIHGATDDNLVRL